MQQLVSDMTFARCSRAQLVRLLVPLRLLPADMQTGAPSLGMGLALSPSLLASSLGLGRLLGGSHAAAAAEPSRPEQTDGAPSEAASPPCAASMEVR